MGLKLKNRLKHLLLVILALTSFQEGSGVQYEVNGYSPVYSTMPKSDSITNSGSVTGSVDNSPISRSDSVGDGSGILDSQRSNGVSQQGAQGQQTYYYEMYPQQSQSQYAVPKIGQKCVYTESGMKCQYRRDGSDVDSYSRQGVTGTAPDGDDGDGGFGGLGGLAGLIGLLGLKGLKGLKAMAPMGVGLLPLLPLLPILPLLILPLLPLLLLLPLLPIIILLGPILLLLFLPIPVISVPNGRSLKSSPVGQNIARIASDVLQSEECVERLSCEIARMARKSGDWFDKAAEMLPKEGKIVEKVKTGLKKVDKVETSRATNTKDNCSRFTCNPKSIFAKHFTSKV